MGQLELNISQAVAFFVLDLLPSWQLPEVATNALESGLDSPALRELAGETQPVASACEPLFKRAIAELGINFPEPETAQLIAARFIASQIIAGDLTPYEGASAIWRDITLKLGNGPNWGRLSLFIGLASEYEDNPKYRKEYEREIIEAARELVGKSLEP